MNIPESLKKFKQEYQDYHRVNSRLLISLIADEIVDNNEILNELIVFCQTINNDLFSEEQFLQRVTRQQYYNE